jgi:hypothetical protein
MEPMKINSLMSNQLTQTGSTAKNINTSLEKLEKTVAASSTSDVVDIKSNGDLSTTKRLTQGIELKNINISIIQIATSSLGDMRDSALMINELATKEGPAAQHADEIDTLLSKIGLIKEGAQYDGKNVFGLDISLSQEEMFTIPDINGAVDKTAVPGLLKDIESLLTTLQTTMRDQEVGITNMLAALSSRDAITTQQETPLNRESINQAHNTESLSHKIGALLSF